MAQFSPEIIDHTISIFESRTGREISREEGRQAIENISGFFRVLQEWDKSEKKIAKRKESLEGSESMETVEGIGS
jgi:hypothetical protein